MSKSNHSRRGIKKSNNRRRSPAPKKIGNSYKISCTFCNPQLTNRLDNKKNILNECEVVKEELKKIKSLSNFL
jgi:hypothetical protein